MIPGAPGRRQAAGGVRVFAAMRKLRAEARTMLSGKSLRFYFIDEGGRLAKSKKRVTRVEAETRERALQ